MYKITVAAASGVVEVKLAGMMSVEEVTDYIRDLKASFIQHRLRSYSLLLDISECPIQQQDMLRAMGEHMATMPKARSIGIITGSSLARMQARRLFTQPYARIVSNMEVARDWVLNGVEPPKVEECASRTRLTEDARAGTDHIGTCNRSMAFPTNLILQLATRALQ